MTRTLAALRSRVGLFLLGACALSAPAQMTTVTAPSGTLKVAGTTIATGTINWTPVDLATGIPVAVRAGTVVYDIQAIPCTVTAGAINAGCNVPDLASAVSLTPNVQLGYNVRISDSSTNKGFTIQGITGVTGSTWSLTTYSPTQVTPVSASSITTGSSVPAACRGAAIFYTQTNPPLKYDCVGNIFAQETTSGGSGVSIVWRGAYSSSTTYAVNDATSLNGSSYISLQASNINHQPDTSSSFWGLMAAKGADGATGTPGTTGSNGTSPVITIGTVTPLSAGATPTATLTGSASNPVLNLGIPAGATGSSPAAPTFTVGTVGTGSAAVTITGSAPNYTLNFTFPSGGSSVTLKTNGTNNGSQTVLNLKPGSGISVADDGTGGVTIGLSATINGKAISTNPSLNATDVGADASGAAATVASNLSAEVTRATGIEGGLSSSIGSETTRATAAETANSIPDTTVGALPTPVVGLLGRKYVVTDGVAGSVCSSGSGAVRAICEVYTVSTGVYGYRAVSQGAGEKNIPNGILGADANGLALPANLPAATPSTQGATKTGLPALGIATAARALFVVGDSYLAGLQGPSTAGTGQVALIAQDFPYSQAVTNKAVGGTFTPQIALSSYSNFAPSATTPTIVLSNGGHNDPYNGGTNNDGCGNVASSNCITNYQQALRFHFYWGSLAKSNWLMASNNTSYTGTYTTDTTIALSANSGVTGTASKCSSTSCSIVWTLPSTNNGHVAVAQTTTNGGTGNYTISIGGALQTNPCTSTTTFSSGPCGGQALLGLTSAPQANEFYNAAWAGATPQVVITHTNSNNVGIIGIAYIPTTLPVNTNIVLHQNSGNLFDVNGYYSAAESALLTADKAAGLPLCQIDIRSKLASLPANGTANTTFANHPGDQGQDGMRTQTESDAAACGYQFTSPNAGATVAQNNPTFQGPITARYGFSNTVAGLFHHFNSANVIGGGWLFFDNGSTAYSGMHFGQSTVPDGSTTQYYISRFSGASDYGCEEQAAPYAQANDNSKWVPSLCTKFSTGDLTSRGMVRGNHFGGALPYTYNSVNYNPAPTAANQSATGTGGACSITGTDTAITLALTVGSSSSAGAQCIVTFGTAYLSAPRFGQPGATNSASAGALTNLYANATTTTWTLSAAAALAAGSYVWHVVFMQ